MRRLQLVACSIVVLATLGRSLFAQAPYDPALQQGMQPFQSYQGGDLDSVNLATGMLSLHIPVVSFPQRGTMHLDYSVNYSNPSATAVIPDLGPGYYQASGSSVYIANNAFPVASYVTIVLPCAGCATYTLTLSEGNGTTHPLNFINSSSTQARTVDGTGFLVTSPLTTNCSITDQSGVTTTWGSGTVTATDPNGNQMTSTTTAGEGCNSNGPSGSGFYTAAVTDTMGRNIPAVTSPWVVPGPNGGTATYQTTGSGTTQKLVLPDLTAYTFNFTSLSLPLLHRQTTAQTYDVLTSISLPSGGTISYGYAQGAIDSPGSGYYTVAPITSRTVDAKDGTGPHTWTYSYAYTYDPSSGLTTETTTVTDPLGNKSIHVFSPYGPYEVQLQEEDSSGNLLKTVQTSYGNVSVNLGGGPANVNFNPASITTIWPSGQQSTVSMTYDTDHNSGFIGGGYKVGPGEPGFVPNATPSSYTLNPWTKTETDYGYGASGAVLRTTNTNYLAFSNSSYLANNLLDLPSSVQVLDGNGTQRSNVTFGYDEASLQASNITVQKVAGESSPGNLTSIHRWLSNGSAASQSPCNVSVASGGYLVTNNVYFDTGELQSSTDPCSYTTSYLYSSAYSGTYPTTVINALGQQTTFGYDFNTKLLTSTTDPNSETTTNSYDIMGRLTGIAYPDGGSTSYCYTDMGGSTCTQASSPPYSVVTTQAISSSPTVNKTSTSAFDGIGSVLTQLTSDPNGTIEVDSAYDALRRKHTVSNPYRNTSDPTYGISTYSYDGLSRLTTMAEPDGGTLQMCYDGVASAPAVANCSSRLGSVSTGSWVDSTDESGNHSQKVFDALGRMVEVMEPGASNTPTLETDYQYDALGDLTSANQIGNSSNGESPHSRSFVYDSLSRLVTSVNPETATTSYSYDADGNLLSKTDARGITVIYTYDKLNRLTSKTYQNDSSGTSSSCYLYDTATSGIGRLGAEWTQTGACAAGTTSIPSSGVLSSRTISAYDPMGRILAQQQCVSCSAANPVSYSYDLAGNIVTATNGLSASSAPGMLTTYTHDSAGNLSKITTSWDDGTHPPVLFEADQSINGVAAYSPFGELTAATYGVADQASTGSLVDTRSYDVRNRLVTKFVTGSLLIPTTVTFSINPSTFTTTENPQMLINVSCNSACGEVALSIDGHPWIPGYDVDSNGNYPAWANIYFWPSSYLTPGPHIITASYLGNSTYAPSSQSYPITIAPIGTQQTSESLSLDPPSEFTTVEDAIASVHVGCNSACGQVQFTIDGNQWVVWDLDSNGDTSADSYWWMNPTYFSQGTHTLAANYLGSPTYAATSQSVSFTVVPVGSQPATVTLSPSTTTFSSTDQFSLPLVVGCGSTCSGGLVQMTIDGNQWVLFRLDDTGTAIVSTSWAGNTYLTQGTHTIIAHYMGNPTYAASDSSPLTVTVTP